MLKILIAQKVWLSFNVFPVTPASRKEVIMCVLPSSSQLSHYNLHWRERRIFFFPSHRFLISQEQHRGWVLRPLCTNCSIPDNYGSDISSIFVTFLYLHAWHVSFLPPLQSPSLLANLVKNLLLSSKLFWHHLFLEVSPDPSKEDLSIHSLQKPHPLWPLLLMCLMSSTCIFISMIVCLLSQGRKLYPIQLWQFRSGILHPDFTLKSPGEL